MTDTKIECAESYILIFIISAKIALLKNIKKIET
jgi:hypothetical protein